MGSIRLTNAAMKRLATLPGRAGIITNCERSVLLRRTIAEDPRAQRFYNSDTSGSSGPSFRSSLGPLSNVLWVAGLGATAATAYGMYYLYGMVTLWPTQLRTDLRSGLKARDRGDLQLSAKFLQRAWEKSKTLPIEVFKDEPYLKISGIAVLLASVLEADGKRERAYDVYVESLEQLQQAGIEQELSGPEKLREIAVSYKLGELAAELQRREDEERYLVWAVEAILKSVFRLGDQPEGPEQTDHVNHVLETTRSQSRNPETRTMLSELSLPEWATGTDIASPLEALGTFYAEAGQVDFAVPLYLQAISILFPPSPKVSTAEERCRGAQLMANLSELIIRKEPKLTEEILHQAEAWALRGLQITVKAKEELPNKNPTCELAFAVALFNVAALRRMAGDNVEAKRLFALSLKQSKSIGLQSGIEHAEQALRELEDPASPTPKA